jgi:polyhydroxyalkanoate synthesis regulator protein
MLHKKVAQAPETAYFANLRSSPSHSGATRMATFGQPVTIKADANQRLYNASTGSYVSLEDLAAMVEDDRDFIVWEAQTGADITRSILKQIILRRASHG